MYGCLRKPKISLFRRIVCRQSKNPINVLLVILLLSGCASSSTWQQYENHDLGIKLEMPSNWDVKSSERNSTIILENRKISGKYRSARVEIHGSACVSVSSSFKDSSNQIELQIARIRVLYNLVSVTVVQQPTKIEIGENEVTKAAIAIPTISMPEDDVRNQMGKQDPSLIQTIEIFAIINNNHFVVAYIYDGSSIELNAEAEEIVASIQLICSK